MQGYQYDRTEARHALELAQRVGGLVDARLVQRGLEQPQQRLGLQTRHRDTNKTQNATESHNKQNENERDEQQQQAGQQRLGANEANHERRERCEDTEEKRGRLRSLRESKPRQCTEHTNISQN